MISKRHAEELVINELFNENDVIIEDRLTIEEDWGWVFYYNSRKYIETGDLSHALAGNAPYLVDKATGKLYITGTAEPVEYYIERFKKTGTPL